MKKPFNETNIYAYFSVICGKKKDAHTQKNLDNKRYQFTTWGKF